MRALTVRVQDGYGGGLVLRLDEFAKREGEREREKKKEREREKIQYTFQHW